MNDFAKFFIFLMNVMTDHAIKQAICQEFALRCVYAEHKTNVGKFRKWSLTQNRPTILKQFCVGEVEQPLAKFVTG